MFRNGLSCQNNIVNINSHVAIWNPMYNTASNYRCTLDSDGELSIKSYMNDWRLTSDNAFTKIDVSHDYMI